MSNKRVSFDDGFTTSTAPAATVPTTADVVSNTPAGNISSTTVQAAINELDSEKQALSEKGNANGYASLDGSGKVPSTQLPSYVDDVLEYANFASLPGTGETGKIYVTLDTNKTYRWSGSVYIEISPSAVTSVNGYTGAVTLSKSDVGLSNVDNTSDATKNAATATLTNKTLTSPVINSPTGITKSDVGLSNVDNTSDATKNSATATLTNKSISGINNTLTNISLTSSVIGILPIANGGTNNTSFTALSGNIAPIIYFDGSKLATDATASHLGYDTVTDTVYTSAINIQNTTTQTAKFTNTSASGPTAGAGMQGYSDDGAALATGDRLGFYALGGSTNASHTTTNSIAFTGLATENWGASNAGSKAQIEVTPNTTTTRTVAMTIDQSGNVGIGSAITSPSNKLQVAGTIESTTGGFKFPDGTTQTSAGLINPMTSTNDLIVGGASGAASRLAVGSEGQVLSVSGGNVAWANGGSGSGSLNTLFQLTGADQASWTKGNSATFLASGTLAGTFTQETGSPLQGTQSYKYVQATSINDWLASPAQAVDIRYHGQQAYFSAVYSYDGASTDIKFVVYDVTNSAIISSSTDYVVATNGAVSTAVIGVIIPSTCTSIKVGMQVLTSNSGKILRFDSLQLSLDIGAITNVANLTDWTSYTPTFTGFGTAASIEFFYRRVGNNCEIKGRFTVGTATATEARVSLPTGLTSQGTSIIPSLVICGYGSAAGANTTDFGGKTVLIEPSVSYVTFGEISATTNSSTTKQNANAITVSSVMFQFNASVPILGWDSYNSNVIVPVNQVSSDTMNFVFQSTALTGNEAVGTFNTYTYAANTNTATIATSAPTQTTTSMATDGPRVYGRAFNATSAAASPVRIDIVVGKGLKNINLSAYGTAGKVNPASYDVMYDGSPVTEYGTRVFYNETTGILSLNGGVTGGGVTASHSAGLGLDGTVCPSVYFVINAAKTPSAAALPVLLPKIAYLSEVQTSGTNGGASTAATYNVRTLNTIVDSFSIVTSLSANSFTLPAGTYKITASAPAYQVNSHRIRIRNTTDSTSAVLGSSEWAQSGGTIQNRSVCSGEVTITAAKAFQLQHYTQSTVATNGLGNAASSGESEIFSVVEILKIK